LPVTVDAEAKEVTPETCSPWKEVAEQTRKSAETTLEPAGQVNIDKDVAALRTMWQATVDE
jgi:hypothetical protein